MIALVIPEAGPLVTVDLGSDPGLEELQGLVGGMIEALPLPGFIAGAAAATAYINEEGKFDPDCGPNMRATDFMVPGVGLFWGDYIAGPFVLLGFDPSTGTHRELPEGVIARARLIEQEAGA